MRPSSTLVPVRWLALAAILLAAAAPAAMRLAQPVPATAQPEASAEPQPTRTGRGSWTTFVNGQRVAMQWTGPFRISPNQRDIEWVEPGESVKITNGARWFATGVEIKALENGQLEPHYFRGGFEKPFEPDGRQFLTGALERITLGTGVNASVAVARALEEGGADAVREAIGRLRTDSARRAYYIELIGQGDFSPAAIVGLVREAAGIMTSDSALAQLLTTAGRRVAADEGATISIIEMTKQLSDDRTQVQALDRLMPDQPSPKVAAAILEAAATVGSDSSRYTLLTDVATRGGLTPETRPAYFALVNAMSSTTYRSRILSAVGASADAPAVTVRAVLDASRDINDDTERRRIVASTMGGERVDPATASTLLSAVAAVSSNSQRAALLQEFIKKGGLTADTAPLFFPLVATMSSGAYQHRVLDDVSAMPTLAPAVITGFLEAAAQVRGDQDRTSVLLTFVGRHAIAGADRERYLVAADGISSESYQNRVLAALVRAERGRR